MPPPITDTPLFTGDDLNTLVEEEISAEKAIIVEAVVWGWLKPILGLDERPEQVSDEMYSWAIELGAIFSENPSGLTEAELGERRAQYSAERRNDILQTVAASGAGDGTVGSNTPRGCFPPPLEWPCGFWA